MNYPAKKVTINVKQSNEDRKNLAVAMVEQGITYRDAEAQTGVDRNTIMKEVRADEKNELSSSRKRQIQTYKERIEHNQAMIADKLLDSINDDEAIAKSSLRDRAVTYGIVRDKMLKQDENKSITDGKSLVINILNKVDNV